MKILFFLLASFTLFSFLNSDGKKINSSLLWEIQVDENHKSFIFGTIHMIEKDKFYFPKKLKQIIGRSELLILELDKVPGPLDVLKLLKEKSYQTIDQFNKTQQDSIFNWFEDKMNYNEQRTRGLFYKMPPVFVSQTMILKLIDKKLKSYEKEIFKIAKKKNIQTLGLETLDFQFKLLTSLPDSISRKSILQTVKHDSLIKSDFNKLTDIYLNQNIDSIHQFIVKSEEYSDISTKELIDQRNNNWVPILENEFNKSNCFIAVGSGHLGGKNGIINLLIKKGYQLKPISLN